MAAKRGVEVTETLQVSVQPGYHVNSNQTKGEFLIPLKLVWSGTALQPERVVYPRSEQIRVAGDDVVVFTGKFAIETRFKVSASASPGLALMTGKLTYQACNNQMCFRPASAEIRLPVVIE